jgi:hypothetical protein
MTSPLRTAKIDQVPADVDFTAAKAWADELAARELEEPVCLAWYDRAHGRESPAHTSECHGDCDMPGDVEYAVTRGAELEVVVGGGAYVFCYRPLGEFADQ